jgi:hypothetical protein
MFHYLILIVLIPLKICAASGGDHEELKSIIEPKGKAPTGYQTMGTEGVSPDPEAPEAQEDWNPAQHRIIAHSRVVKKYVEISTICCFLSEGWFHTGAFITGVATCTLAGINYGISDPSMKETLGLVLVVATAATAVLQKLEAYARTSVSNQEREYAMFGSSPSGNGTQETAADHTTV